MFDVRVSGWEAGDRGHSTGSEDAVFSGGSWEDPCTPAQQASGTASVTGFVAALEG